MRSSSKGFAALSLMLAAASAQAAGKLVVTDAWIREAPPGATMLAGYASLRNDGDEPISVLTVQSDAFRMASVHETIVADGVSKMRELHRLDLAPGASVDLVPGGKHLMLMHPRGEVHAGDRVDVRFLLGDGRRVETHFVVAAPSDDAAADDHSHHRH